MRRRLAGLLTLLLTAGAVAVAQEPDDSLALDELEPAVSSAELAELDTSLKAGEPQPAAVLARDVRRTQGSAGVMDEIDLERSEITGNQELPKVLYIVPWQKSEAGEIVGKPVNTLLDEVLAPVDRTEFLRRVEYYDDLYGE